MEGVAHILERRHSVRAFLPDPVPQPDLAEILRLARRAPSGANLQPGSFHALTGAPLTALKAALSQALEDGRPIVSEYSYFPDPMPAYLKARQRAAGYGLYAAQGIEKRDIAGRRAQFARNYRFFDAPVGLVVSIDRAMGKGCYMDLGMALMALMLGAEELGYAATGIGALANYGDLVHEQLGLAQDQLVVCGMAIGRANPDAEVNGFRTARAELSEFTSFRGFNDAE